MHLRGFTLTEELKIARNQQIKQIHEAKCLSVVDPVESNHLSKACSSMSSTIESTQKFNMNKPQNVYTSFSLALLLCCSAFFSAIPISSKGSMKVYKWKLFDLRKEKCY